MAKKIISGVVLVLVVACGVNNWFSGELSFLGGSARYERMLNEHRSIGANVYWNNFFVIWNVTGNRAFCSILFVGQKFFCGNRSRVSHTHGYS